MKSFLNTSLIILTFASNLFFSSCSKDNGNPSVDNPSTSSKPLIETWAYFSKDGRLGDMITYQYDKQGRPTKYVINNGDYATYEYSGSIITEKYYDKNSGLHMTVFQLNNNGFCISASSDDGDLITFQYDSNGYRKSMTEKYSTGGYTTSYTVSDGNYVTIKDTSIIKSASSKEFNHLSNTFSFKNLRKKFVLQNNLKSASKYIGGGLYEYKFFNDKTNTIDWENEGISFLGKQNRNLIKKDKRLYYAWGDQSNNTYTYEYDSKGRATKQIDEHGDYTIYTYVE